MAEKYNGLPKYILKNGAQIEGKVELLFDPKDPKDAVNLRYITDRLSLIDHGSLQNLNERDDHKNYIHTKITRSIKATHVFDPEYNKPAFNLSADARKQYCLIKGLNSEYLNGNTSDFYLDRANHIGKIKISDLETMGAGSTLDSDMLDGKHGSDYAPYDHTHDHSKLSNLNLDSHTFYVHSNVSRNITAQHTFNPNKISSPFILGTNAWGQLVSGLNSELLNGLNSDSFLLKTGDTTLGNITSNVEATDPKHLVTKGYVDKLISINRTFKQHFTNNELDTNNCITFNHDLKSLYLTVQIFNSDLENITMPSKSIKLLNINQIKLNMSSLTPFTGSWRIVVISI